MTEEQAPYITHAGLSDLEASFLYHWRILAPGAPVPVHNHKFCAERKWMFDFAWIEQMVAVECEGGIWLKTKTGRSAGHAHPDRFEKDCKKYNRANTDGWRVFRCTAGMLKNDPAAFIEIIKEAIDETQSGYNSESQTQ